MNVNKVEGATQRATRIAFRGICLAALGAILVVRAVGADAGNARYVRHGSWSETMDQMKAGLRNAPVSPEAKAETARQFWFKIRNDFPVEWDWALQDGGMGWVHWLAGREDNAFQAGVLAKVSLWSNEPDPQGGGKTDWLSRFEVACRARRQARLATLLAQAPEIIFTKHRTLRPSFFAYTEGQSDAQNEHHFLPGSQLCLLKLSSSGAESVTLVSDPSGAIRDPAISWEADRVVFAWKKSLREDDFHLYELDLRSKAIRQLTSGLGFADYEPAFLPNGDLIFASTRCVQTVDCWWTEVSNLYTCDRDGKFLRRVTFDQVHSIFPQVLDDGRVVYTRWDYNDRGQIFPQPLFQMNADGTAQTEFYGNNSWFPTTIAHARGIPGTAKVLAILCGHHTAQAGKLAVIDPAKGRQENSGVQLVAPPRPTPAERIDAYGQDGALWQYPYPLSEAECLVTFAPLGWGSPGARSGDADFGIYWMALDGSRELLVSDPNLPCSQPVPLRVRPRPPMPANRVDYGRTNGIFYLQDIYQGPGLAGVKRGTIRKVRVVGLQFRAAGVGHNGSSGPGGGALISTPISVGNGSWDVKVVLGEATVHEDGSAFFQVPARTPVYFQAIDDRGYAAQTMRSWSTLQPGEVSACVGCHEHKNTSPAADTYMLGSALRQPAQVLEPFHGPARGFSFNKEIQPILDKHCIRCHRDRSPVQQLLNGTLEPLLTLTKEPLKGKAKSEELAFSLLGQANEDATAKRFWSDAYLVLTAARGEGGSAGAHTFSGLPEGRVVNWISSQSVPEPLPPYSAGSARSSLPRMLREGHQGVRLDHAEMEAICCWIDLLVPFCGDYREANAWSTEETQKYENFASKRAWMEDLERSNLADLRSVLDPVGAR